MHIRTESPQGPRSDKGGYLLFCGRVQLPAPELRRYAARVECEPKGITRSTENSELVARKKEVIGASYFNWESIPQSVSLLKGEAGGFEVMLEVMLLPSDLDVRSSCYIRRRECR